MNFLPHIKVIRKNLPKPLITRPKVMRKKLLKLSTKGDAKVTKAALKDLDSSPLTAKQWDKVKPSLIRGRGRPLGSGNKEQVTLRIDRDVLAFYKSKGDGWQTFINNVLTEIKREVKSIKALERKLNQSKLI